MNATGSSNGRVRVAIAGVGNCASSFVQGIHFYRDAPREEQVPGLMHVDVGGYHVGDVEVVAAFDVVRLRSAREIDRWLVSFPGPDSPRTE